MKKIGIMGGTFNPIHMAHLMLAEQAYEQFQLDKILFMPTKKPPHKSLKEIISDEHRINMILKAIEGNPHFELSTLELQREGTTYTVDTLTYLRSLNKDEEYYFIIGGDSLFDIESWKEPSRVFQLSHILASNRNQVNETELKNQMTKLMEQYNAKIELIQIPTIEISSHEIRQRCKSEKSIRYFVPYAVYRYILEHELYR